VLRYALTRFFGRTEQEAFEQTANYGAVISVVSQPLAQPGPAPQQALAGCQFQEGK
jgi:hypothetical protein